MNEENILNNQEVDIVSSHIEEKEIFSKLDCIVAIVSLILGFLFIRFAVVNTTGFITTGIFDIILTVGLIYAKKNGYMLKKNILSIIVIYLFSLVYSITANDFIKFLNSIFLILAITYTIFLICNDSKKSPKFYFYAQMKSLFSYPFANFGKCPTAITQSMLNSGSRSNIKYILIGLLITAPVTFLVAILLTSADLGMESILNNLLDNILDNLNISLIFQLLFGFLIGCSIFSMMYTNIYKINFSPYDDTIYELKLNNKRFCPSLIVYSALTPLCILYIMYIVSQIGYFTNAFSGTLYEGYTYSEYARRGFFELTTIACINLTVIFMANLFCKRLGNTYQDKKPLALKIYTIIFSVFTIFIISTAMSKMFLYMGEYGLTQLRVYTSWFMILLGLIFIIMIVREFKEFNISSVYKIVFTIMFGILCFCRVDRVIANTNIYLYENDYIQDLDTYYYIDLSYDAYTPILEYTIQNNDNYFKNAYECLKYLNYDRYNLSAMEFMNTYEKYYK